MTTNKNVSRTNSKKINSARAFMSAKVEKRQKLYDAKSRELKSLLVNADISQQEVNRALQSANNRIAEDARVLRFFEDENLCKVFLKYNFSIKKLLEQKSGDTREFKKRFGKWIEALQSANSLATGDKKFLAGLLNNPPKKCLSLSQIQNLMEHSGTTQARYLSNFVDVLGVGQFDRSTGTTTFEWSKPFVRDLARSLNGKVFRFKEKGLERVLQVRVHPDWWEVIGLKGELKAALAGASSSLEKSKIELEEAHSKGLWD